MGTSALLIQLMRPLRLPLITVGLAVLNAVLGVLLDPVKKVHELVAAHLDFTYFLRDADAHQVVAEGVLDLALQRIDDLNGLPLIVGLVQPRPHVVENMAGADLNTVIRVIYAHLREKLLYDPDNDVLVLVPVAILEVLDAHKLISEATRGHIPDADRSAADGGTYAAIVDLHELGLRARANISAIILTIIGTLGFHEHLQW